ncbi:MAG: hypothetical protein M1828_004033 [Chrysothrix sp. TS-e1954]|nr:MAG: hypothetical protein M1828_004033 [Chrysothrix sp. TS-e1954]
MRGTSITASVIVAVVLCVSYSWTSWWVLSGAAPLTLVLLLGHANGNRVLPTVDLWTLLSTVNLFYAVAATSWLLYWFFLTGCYPVIFITCLFQFAPASAFARSQMRRLIRQLHFVHDLVAFFGLPALEIDTDVQGLMVIRGVTFCISSLTIIANGIEVGIKLSDDLELALQTDEVVVSLFRGIQISPVYGNIKGGSHEMTFGRLADDTQDPNGDAIIHRDSVLLNAASSHQLPHEVKLTDHLTGGNKPQPTSPGEGLKSVKQISSNDLTAEDEYQKALKDIQTSSTITSSRRTVKDALERLGTEGHIIDPQDELQMHAAMCSDLHTKPSVPHPPRRSIRVTTLQTLMPPWMRAFLHRLPMLYRLLLTPLSYFHPIKMDVLTVAGSGGWIDAMLQAKLFQDYADDDMEIRRLARKVRSWLTDANFVAQMTNFKGQGQVPFLTTSDIECKMAFSEVVAFRSLPQSTELKQVVRLGGADATIVVPNFLLPHHEHLLPAVPSREAKQARRRSLSNETAVPKIIQAEKAIEQLEKDEANVNISAHVHLPACCDAELLDFVAALVKATKVVELEKEPSPLNEEVHGFRHFTSAVNKSVKDSMKRGAVDAVINDRLISKLVGKITRKLETAQGNAGYAGDIPVALPPYRAASDGQTKLLS